MTPDHTDTPKEPQPEISPCCFGMLCHLHQTCQRYYLVNGAPASLQRIDTCGIGLNKPKFLEVVK